MAVHALSVHARLLSQLAGVRSHLVHADVRLRRSSAGQLQFRKLHGMHRGRALVRRRHSLLDRNAADHRLRDARGERNVLLRHRDHDGAIEHGRAAAVVHGRRRLREDLAAEEAHGDVDLVARGRRLLARRTDDLAVSRGRHA